MLVLDSESLPPDEDKQVREPQWYHDIIELASTGGRFTPSDAKT